jgi:hypothetical protein
MLTTCYWKIEFINLTGWIKIGKEKNIIRKVKKKNLNLIDCYKFREIRRTTNIITLSNIIAKSLKINNKTKAI